MSLPYHEVYIGALDVSRFVRSVSDDTQVLTHDGRDGTIHFHARIRRDSKLYEDLRLLAKTQMIVPVYFKSGDLKGVMQARTEFFGHGIDCFAPFGIRANVIQISNGLHEAALAAMPAIQNTIDAIAALGISMNQIDLSAFEALGEINDGED